MSDIKVDGFQASEILSTVASDLTGSSDDEKAALIKKTNGIFELRVKNAEDKVAIWTIDMKKTGTVYVGPAKSKVDVTIILNDDVLVQLADGKLNGQKAFMTGQLKTKGNIMLATKLDGLLKGSKAKL